MKYEPGFVHKQEIPQYPSACCLHLRFFPPQNVCLLAEEGKLMAAIVKENYFRFWTLIWFLTIQLLLPSRRQGAELGVQNWTQHPSPSLPKWKRVVIPFDLLITVLPGHPPFATRVHCRRTSTTPWKRQQVPDETADFQVNPPNADLGSIWQRNSSDNYLHSCYCRRFGSVFLRITVLLTLCRKMGLGEKYFLKCHFHLSAFLLDLLSQA